MSTIDDFRAAREFVLEPESDFEVERVEVGGMSLLGYVHAPQTMRELWLKAIGHGDAEYIVYLDERLSYKDAATQVAGFANWMKLQGIGEGDRVAIAMRNNPEWILAHWAVNSIGAVVVGLNAWWIDTEMVYALHDSQPKLLVGDGQRLSIFAGIRDQFPELKLVSVRDPAGSLPCTSWEQAITTGGELPEATIDTDSEACIFYTSGTTGQPKGALLTHRGCVANVMNVMATGFINAIQSTSQSGQSLDAAMEVPEFTVLLNTPLFHAAATNCVVQPSSVNGGRIVMMHKWDPVEAMRLIEKEKVTNMSGVPTMTRDILTHPDRNNFNLSTLQSIGGGGAAMQAELVSKVSTNMDNAMPTQGYGMTEACGLISYIAGKLFQERPNSVGPVVPTMEARCIDADTNPLPAGEVGEICVRGTNVIKGYLNRPEATAQTIVDGWLHTGDLGYFDEDGFLYVVDRAKDMILRGGENIYSAEIENAIFDHQAVFECAAFAVPDDRLGEEVGAAVYLRGGAALDAVELREHLATKISAFKIPRYLWFVTEPLPRNASGKFLKSELQVLLDPDSACRE